MAIQSVTGHPYDTAVKQPVKRAYASGSYGQIHYHYAGVEPGQSKHATLFLHMTSKSGRLWRQVLGQWPGEGLLLAPDNPGYGESDPPPADPEVDIDDYAREMFLLLDELGVETVDVAGIHTGSLMAVAMAASQPNRVRKLVQFSAPLFNAEELAVLREGYQQPIPLDREGTRFITMWQRIMHYMGPEADMVWAGWSMRDNLLGGEAYEYGHRAAFNYTERYREILPTLTQPHLIVNPDDDCQQVSLRVEELGLQHLLRNKPEWVGSAFLDYRAEDVAEYLHRFFQDEA